MHHRLRNRAMITDFSFTKWWTIVAISTTIQWQNNLHSTCHYWFSKRNVWSPHSFKHRSIEFTPKVVRFNTTSLFSVNICLLKDNMLKKKTLRVAIILQNPYLNYTVCSINNTCLKVIFFSETVFIFNSMPHLERCMDTFMASKGTLFNICT